MERSWGLTVYLIASVCWMAFCVHEIRRLMGFRREDRTRTWVVHVATTWVSLAVFGAALGLYIYLGITRGSG